jgi:hypothetical protein
MPPAVSTSRLPWVDNLRTFVILLVVNVHACYALADLVRRVPGVRAIL